MMVLSAQRTRQLAGQLDYAARTAREHAAAETYRATACQAIGERLLRLFHSRRAADFHTQADDLDRSAAWLRAQHQPSRLTAVKT